MEFILQKTDIFDKEIGAKLDMIIRANQDSFIKGYVYKLTVSFHVNLLNDPRFEEFNIPVPSKTNKGTKKDKIYDVMSYQLNSLEQILEHHGIEIYTATIQGDNLETESIFKIEICEDTSEHKFMGKGKNKKRMKVKSIVPSLPYTQANVSKIAFERLCKIYFDIINIIKTKNHVGNIGNRRNTRR